MQVAVRALKAQLSSVLARAQAGEAIDVTSHNRLIARIVGVPAEAAVALRAPIAQGALTWTARKPRLQPPLALAEQGTAVSQMVLEDRG